MSWNFIFGHWAKAALRPHCICPLVNRYWLCCGQLWAWHMFCGKGLWWVMHVMPPNKIHGSHWNTIGFQWIVWTFVRHTVSAPGSGQGHLGNIDQSQAMIKSIVNTIGYLQFLPTGQHGLCFGYLFQVRSLYVPFINGPPLGVRFRESLVFRLHSEIDQIHLSIEGQCGTAHLPLGDCHRLLVV